MSAHRPRKRFGQNFLRDNGVIQRIAAALPETSDVVVEIGPGRGALTNALIQRITPLHVIEIDRDLVAELRGAYSSERVRVHEADVLNFNFCTLCPPQRKLLLVGNLPYNISTPLLFRLLNQTACISEMLFMLQKEVVDRMAAKPDTEDYGRLSVMIQWRLRVEPLFDVPPEAFFPSPKIFSTVVRLTPHTTPPIDVPNPDTFARVVKAAFASRRKTLRNNLRGILDAKQLQALGVDPGRRAETLTLQEFACLADAID